MNKKGSTLIIVFWVIAILLILSASLLTRSVSERVMSRKYLEATQAFWLAEAGISQAIYQLGEDFSSSVSPADLTIGSYSLDIETVDSQTKNVTAHGFVPAGSPQVEKVIQATISKDIPPYFYDNAIYSAGEVDLNGNSYSVTGNIRYADELDYSHDHMTGTSTQDESISPLARFDFQEIYDISSAQGNVYGSTRLNNVKKGQDNFPSDFWYSEPSDPEDPTTGVPNVVFVDGDLTLNGNIGTIGGFFAVVGSVLTDPDAQQDATINGNGRIEGLIYTRGEFEINGGGGNLNIDGGIWAGEEAELNGNAAVTYNQDYMDAVENLDLNPDVQISNWKDTQNPYPL